MSRYLRPAGYILAALGWAIFVDGLVILANAQNLPGWLLTG